ncbi:MAG TPA: sigma-70 family RNA polymerase sigma factor [Pseudolabrys sp.]|nr:sigma-70 family RNA polymerase sigma factor [Pseudolabrys sp.]
MSEMETLRDRQRRRATWVALRILPHEAQSRNWLRRAKVTAEEADDLIQEAYCRLAAVDDVDHIDRPGAYFFSIIRNLLIRRRRGVTVVSLESLAEIETLADPDTSPETEVAMRIDAERLRELIAALPDRCRRIVEMRKVEGYSQSEIARLLGISESVVENNVHRGVKAILKNWNDKNDEVRARHGSSEASERGWL